MFPEAMKGMVCGEPSRVHPGGDYSIQVTYSEWQTTHAVGVGAG